MFSRAAQFLYLIAFILLWTAQANAASISFVEQAGGSVTINTTGLTGIFSSTGPEFGIVTAGPYAGGTFSPATLVLGLLSEPGGAVSDIVAVHWGPLPYFPTASLEVGFFSDFLTANLPSWVSLPNCTSCPLETGNPQTIVNSLGLTVTVQSDVGASVPEPSTLVLLGSGIVGLAVVRRRRRRLE